MAFPSRAVPRFLARSAVLAATAGALSACASSPCANPYVLGFQDRDEARTDITHVGVLYGPVVTVPGDRPDTLACSAWEKVRRPADGKLVLRPLYYQLRRIGDGWKVAPEDGR